MARIVLIENRGKTSFWACVADVLQNRRGHDIGWIAQNPAYSPRSTVGSIVNMPLPRESELIVAPIPMALQTDRGRQYFGAGSRHYSYYEARVRDAIDEIAPDVVIGEPTLFHELLIVAECRKQGIPYLHPTMTRYPGGRFAILDGDTQNPAATSGDIWPEEKIASLAESISTGKSLPSYMAKPSRIAAAGRALRRLEGRTRTFSGWLRGERFNTPSPRRKIALQRELSANLETWSLISRMPSTREHAVILYPLQMQPEANIDVWGRPYSDQVAFIRRLLAALPSDGKVAVKANPKSKYEVSAEILALAREEPRVILLPLESRMDEAQALCIGAITVSGTVGFEAVFGRGRCLSLRHPILASHFPNFHAANPETAVTRLLTEPETGRGDLSSGQALLARLVAESFEGTINEPLYDPTCIASDNIQSVANGIESALACVLKELAA